METPPAASTGLLRALRSFGVSLLTSAQNRLELISLDLQAEKLRLIRIFTWISAMVFAGVMLATFASITIVYAFGESLRGWVLAAMTAAYAAGFVAIVIAFRRFLARQPQPFAASIDELHRDRASLRPEE